MQDNNTIEKEKQSCEHCKYYKCYSGNYLHCSYYKGKILNITDGYRCIEFVCKKK